MLMLHVPLSACEGERGRWGLWGLLLVVQLGFCVDGTLLPKYFLLWFLSLWSVTRWSRIRWVARWCQRRGGRGRRGTWGWWRSWSFAGGFRLGVGVFGTLVPCRRPTGQWFDFHSHWRSRLCVVIGLGCCLLICLFVFYCLVRVLTGMLWHCLCTSDLVFLWWRFQSSLFWSLW